MVVLNNLIVLNLFIIVSAVREPSTDKECRKECERNYGYIVRQDPYKDVPIKIGRMEETEDGKSCKCTSHAALYFVINRAGRNVTEFKRHEDISNREAKEWLKRNGFKLRFKVHFPANVILSEHPVPARGEEPDPAEACKESCREMIGFINLEDNRGVTPIADGFVESFVDEHLQCGCAPRERVLDVLAEKGVSTKTFLTVFKKDYTASCEWLRKHGFQVRCLGDRQTHAVHPSKLERLQTMKQKQRGAKERLPTIHEEVEEQPSSPGKSTKKFHSLPEKHTKRSSKKDPMNH